ncbi:hypothetical protein TWF694_008005 [Orbilia ellipsospora]|uniref:NADH:flavin oxidoreductase/NADH oxidase N-terminal domain-containing protein n=1 Tax=Orbilia ellipsospora TaxID=2528407 RepID=A0AAV9XES6_9PEZI
MGTSETTSAAAANDSTTWRTIRNVGAEGVSYFTPAQNPPAASAIENGQPIPKLFRPLTIRGVSFQNRIWMSPMCQYSADDGHLTDWHIAHLGGIISRGPSFTMMEATAIVPEGRISPEDSGLWRDSQIAPMKRIVEFAHSQNQKIGIQLAHAGRKASTTAAWLDRKATATPEVGGWPDNIWAPSAVPFDVGSPMPRELSLEDIEKLKLSYAAAIGRAVDAGFDVIEIHAAHGYLLCEFYSPTTNFRKDKYGGSFENRIRLLLEIIDIAKQVIEDKGKPDTLIFVRYNGSDWMEHDTSVESWKTEDAVELAKIIARTGKVDLLDISSGAVTPKQQITSGPGYQKKFSKAVKDGLAEEGFDIPVSVVGIINTGTLANSLLEEGYGDAIFVGRAFQKNPALVWQWAEELGVEARAANQIGWGYGQKIGRGIIHHSTNSDQLILQKQGKRA